MALSLTACSHQKVEQRTAYWRAETARSLPAGTSLEAAYAFFEQRGVQLKCCLNQLNGSPPVHYATERELGQSLFTRYDLAILVETTPDRRVSKVTVQRWGIGF
jgi:hypothetical protein